MRAVRAEADFVREGRKEGGAVMPSPQDLPEEFGRYRILTQLGQGGMGSVYLAHDTQLDRRVALKVPHFDDDDPAILQRFRQEAQLAARVNHPNFCPVHDVGVFNGVDYFTMPIIEGTPLTRLLGPNRLWGPRDAVELLRKVALAVAQLHLLGIIHRDLKPANIMIRPDGEPIVMDFGLALPSGARTRLTATGEPLGTPAYMPPEQARGEPDRIGPGSDVYSLGVILYELVTGKLPFNGQVFSLFAQILHAAPPAPSFLRHDVGIEIDMLCARAMAKEPERRFPNAGVLADALGAYLGESSNHHTPTNVYPGVSTMIPDSQLTAVRAGPAPLSPELVHVKCSRCQQTLLVLSDLADQEAPCPNCRDFHDTPAMEARRSTPELPRPSTGRPGDPQRPTKTRHGAAWLAVALVCLLLLAPVLIWLPLNRLRPDSNPDPDPDPDRKTNSVGMKLVRIPRGKFLMGSPDTEEGRSDDEGPQHEVEITRAFWMGATEVTTAQFRVFVEETNYKTEWEQAKMSNSWNKNLVESAADHPVLFVTWNDAMKFCEWLSKKEGETCTLPTEAEWEYACRAGSQTPFFFGERNEEQLRQHAWFLSNSKARPQAAGTKKANAWGLFDVCGNVWEWCSDGYADYTDKPQTDPKGDPRNNNRVMRGGCWSSGMNDCRSAVRVQQPRERAFPDVGFRIIVRIP
jgi:eukaryotic-like serine/threonine-protein kinase